MKTMWQIITMKVKLKISANLKRTFWVKCRIQTDKVELNLNITILLKKQTQNCAKKELLKIKVKRGIALGKKYNA